MPKVTAGDCIVSIAHTLKIRDYATLWDANGALKAKRSNPNQLVVDDDVNEPPKGKLAPAPCGAQLRVVIKKAKLPSLRLVVLGPDCKPLDGAAWSVTEPAASGTTGSSGMIEIKEFMPDRKELVLKVTPAVPPPAVVPPVVVAGGQPSYPRDIVAANYEDELLPVAPADAGWVEWTVKIGSLPAHSVKNGGVARLSNLGALWKSGDPEATLTATVKAFQAALLKQPAGAGDIMAALDDLRDQHDNQP